LSSVADLDQKLEVVVIPVSDVDRATAFYKSLGWRQDVVEQSGAGLPT
jgi:catechol 2,3-dioxygenase-like lactoylglutathione lyase family enzyme